MIQLMQMIQPMKLCLGGSCCAILDDGGEDNSMKCDADHYYEG